MQPKSYLAKDGWIVAKELQLLNIFCIHTRCNDMTWFFDFRPTFSHNILACEKIVDWVQFFAFKRIASPLKPFLNGFFLSQDESTERGKSLHHCYAVPIKRNPSCLAVIGKKQHKRKIGACRKLITSGTQWPLLMDTQTMEFREVNRVNNPSSPLLFKQNGWPLQNAKRIEVTYFLLGSYGYFMLKPW